MLPMRQDTLAAFRRLTNQANRPRADGAPAPPASSPVERVVRRRECGTTLPLTEGARRDARDERAEVHAGFRDTERKRAHFASLPRLQKHRLDRKYVV